MATFSTFNNIFLFVSLIFLYQIVGGHSQENAIQHLREHTRRMVGGYQSLDPNSDSALIASNFVLEELKEQNIYSFQPLLLSSSDEDSLEIKVLEASQQVIFQILSESLPEPSLFLTRILNNLY